MKVLVLFCLCWLRYIRLGLLLCVVWLGRIVCILKLGRVWCCFWMCIMVLISRWLRCVFMLWCVFLIFCWLIWLWVLLGWNICMMVSRLFVLGLRIIFVVS